MEQRQKKHRHDSEDGQDARADRPIESSESQAEIETSRRVERAVSGQDTPSDESKGQPSDTSEGDTSESDTRPLPFPYVCALMLLAISVVYAAMLRAGHGNVAAAAGAFGDKENSLIRAGQWWRLITPIFLHGNWGHIGANGLTLLMLGVPMERIYGSRKFFLIYMLAGIAGNLFSFWFSPIPSLGASGALYGLIGAGLVFPLRFTSRIDPRARKAILTQLARAALINLGINLWPGSNLDKWAHLGGLVGGGLAALVWMPDVLEDDNPPRLKSVLLWIAALGLLTLTVTAGVMQWQSVRHPRVTVQTYVALEPGDPWWGLLLPADWRQAVTVPSEGVDWNGPWGAALRIVDSREHPTLRAETQELLNKYKAALTPYAVDGKSGLKAVVRDPARTIQLHQVETDGRLIEFIFTCPPPNYARMQPTFEAMMNTVRFVRPPLSTLAAPPVTP